MMEEQINIIKEAEGTITFANEVLATIAGIAACEVSGVAGMSGGFKDGVVDFLGKKNLTKGIAAAVNENAVTVDVKIVVEYGVRISEVCAGIQQNVKKELELMTGLDVGAVNVDVQGLVFKKQGKNAAEQQ